MDLTTLQYATQDQFINLAHNSVTIPAILIFYVLAIVFYWSAGAIVINTKKDKKLVLNMFWFYLGGITVIGGLLIWLPQISFKIGELVTGFISSGATNVTA